MSLMFNDCSRLASLDLGGWDTRSVLYMPAMFSWCSSLTTLDFSAFDTQSLLLMYSMFYQCSSFKTVYVGEGWTAANLMSDSEYSFMGCAALVGGNGTVYDADRTDTTYAHVDVAGNPGYFTAKGGPAPATTGTTSSPTASSR